MEANLDIDEDNVPVEVDNMFTAGKRMLTGAGVDLPNQVSFDHKSQCVKCSSPQRPSAMIVSKPYSGATSRRLLVDDGLVSNYGRFVGIGEDAQRRLFYSMGSKENRGPYLTYEERAELDEVLQIRPCPIYTWQEHEAACL